MRVNASMAPHIYSICDTLGAGPSPRRISSDEEVDRMEQDRHPRDRMAIDEVC